MSAETPRLYLPFPEENAESWFGTFRDMLNNIDARLFDNLEHLQLVMAALPNAEIVHYGGTDYRFEPDGDVEFISRTLNVKISVTPPRTLILQPNHFIGAVIQSGAVGPQESAWGLFEKMEKDAGYVPLGYVADDYTIYWFNATHLEVGVLAPLFQDSYIISGANKVKVASTDTTADFLSTKLVTGAGLGSAILNPGANEQLQVYYTGGACPTGAGRIYVDALSGSDATGDGTIANPYQTLPVAVTCPRCAPPTSAADFLTPIEFILAPGLYGPPLGIAATSVSLPRRLKISFTGSDVVMNHHLDWGVYEADYTAHGLSTSNYFPELNIVGKNGSGRPQPVHVLPADNAYTAPFFVAAVTAQKKDVGGNAIPGWVLRMRDVVSWFVGTMASGGLVVGDETGVLRLYAQGCTFGDPATLGAIGGQREPVIAARANEVAIYALDVNFEVPIVGNTVIRRATRCVFAGLDRGFGFSYPAGAVGVPDGLIDFGELAFVDCRFDAPIPGFAYDVGWDGVTAPATNPPTFDATSMRSAADLENLLGGPMVIANVGPTSVALVEQDVRFQGVFTTGPFDLAPIVVGAPFPVPMDLAEFHDVGDFVHAPGVPLIIFNRGGQFRFSFLATWENLQLFSRKTIGAAIQLTPGGGVAALVPQTQVYSESGGLNLKSSCVLSGYEMAIQDGDAVELVAWNDSPVVGFGALNLLPTDTWLRIERIG